MVKKANGKWRMCIDFTDLNRACLKDNYPFPRIDALVDSTAGHKLLSFMDAFSGYNQIRMEEMDQEKNSFVTNRGLFCYKVMPFELKNARATYQRLMDKMFVYQIWEEYESLCRRHAGEKRKGKQPLKRPSRNFRHALNVQYEVKSE